MEATEYRRRPGEILARDIRNIGSTLDAIPTPELAAYVRNRVVRESYWKGEPVSSPLLSMITTAGPTELRRSQSSERKAPRSNPSVEQLPTPTSETSSGIQQPWPFYAAQLNKGLYSATLSLADIATLPISEIDRTKLVDGVRLSRLWQGIWNKDINGLLDAFSEFTLFELFEWYPPGSVPDHPAVGPSRRGKPCPQGSA